MPRHRVLLAFGIAWTAALLLSWWVYTRSAAPQTRDMVRIVAAAQDLPIGKRIQAADLKLVEFDRNAVPKGAFQKTADAAERVVSTPLAAGEVVLGSKLAAKGGGEGLAALIEPGYRAVSVQVNESSGVSGFIQPGTRVDVLFTRIFPNGDAATTTILENVKVLAYGRQTDPAKPDPRDTNRTTAAAAATVATLSVSKPEAERLVLAVQRGKIHFALRNGLDAEVAGPSDPMKTSDLGIEDQRKPQPPAPRPVAAPVPPPPPPPPVNPPGVEAAKKAEAKKTVVQIYRGDKLTEQELK